VADQPDTTLDDRQVTGLRWDGGSISGANALMKFDGLCENVVFLGTSIADAQLQMNLPSTPILLEDCFESGTTVTGDTTKLERYTRDQKGTVFGLTSSATSVVAWTREMEPNEVVVFTATAAVEQLNGSEYAAFKVAQAARGAPLTLNFINMVAAFTPGNTISGQTSGASAIVTTHTATGAIGHITGARVEGVFVTGEQIKEVSGSGQAQVNGPAVPGNAALVGSLATIYAGRSTAAMNSAGVSFDVTGDLCRLLLTGISGFTLNWSVNVECTGQAG
jgi:hypothetical protein